MPSSSAPASPTACASGSGDRITLVSPQGRATVVGTLPRLRAFRIVAIFNVGMNEYDSSFVFLPLAAAQAYFQMPDAATQIEVFVRRPDAGARHARARSGARWPTGRSASSTGRSRTTASSPRCRWSGT